MQLSLLSSETWTSISPNHRADHQSMSRQDVKALIQSWLPFLYHLSIMEKSSHHRPEVSVRQMQQRCESRRGGPTGCSQVNSHCASPKKYLEPVPVNDNPTSYWWPYSSSDIEKIPERASHPLDEGEKAFTLYYLVGSARMGLDLETSVVDLQCKVHGVKGLRVMDVSVFPEQISGHSMSPIAAMAFKLSQMIREEHTQFSAHL